VNINGTPVTNSAFNHWMTIASSAASASAAAAGQAAPKAVVPDPPTYKACIAHLEATAPKPIKGQPKPTAAVLKSQCEQLYTTSKQQVLGFLISANWVIGEAAERGVKVTDAEVKKQFNQLRSQQFPTEAALQKFLTSSGYTVSDLLLRVKLQLLSQKITQKVTKEAGKKPSQQEIQKYYNEHKSQYGQPERRNIRLILTKTQAQAEKAKKEISSGKSFASVAKKSSIDPSKTNGGELPGVVKGQESKALDEAIFNAKVSVLGGPIKTPLGYYLYEVTKILPASQQALSAVKSTISQTIGAQKQETSFGTFRKEFVKKWTARTECRSQYMVMDCKAFKAPKTPALPATPPVTVKATTTPTTPTTTTPKK
jgi:foldase protein PrsA